MTTNSSAIERKPAAYGVALQIILSRRMPKSELLYRIGPTWTPSNKTAVAHTVMRMLSSMGPYS